MTPLTHRGLFDKEIIRNREATVICNALLEPANKDMQKEKIIFLIKSNLPKSPDKLFKSALEAISDLCSDSSILQKANEKLSVSLNNFF